MASRLCEAHASCANMPAHLNNRSSAICSMLKFAGKNNVKNSKGTCDIIEPPPNQMLFDELLLPTGSECSPACSHTIGHPKISSFSWQCISRIFSPCLFGLSVVCVWFVWNVSCQLWQLWHATQSLVGLFNLICQRTTSCKFHHQIQIAMKGEVRVVFDPQGGFNFKSQQLDR